jgi:hypothetical protein
MDVSFTKAGERRYSVTIEREHGPALVPRFGPGYDDLLPHDVAHLLVEEHFGIELGVWGQLAAGGGGLFTPAPQENTLQFRRRVQRIAAIGRDDMARSEHLVMVTVSEWERRLGRPQHLAPGHLVEVGAGDVETMVRRLGESSERWQALPQGGSLTLHWPRALTFDISRTHRGRRQEAGTGPRPGRRRGR